MPVTASIVVPSTGASCPSAKPASSTRARCRASALDPPYAVIASATIRTTSDETQYTALTIGISTSRLGEAPAWPIWRRRASTAEAP